MSRTRVLTLALLALSAVGCSMDVTTPTGSPPSKAVSITSTGSDTTTARDGGHGFGSGH